MPVPIPTTGHAQWQQKHKAVYIGSRDNRSRFDFRSREYTTGLEVNCVDKLKKIVYFMDLCLSRL